MGYVSCLEDQLQRLDSDLHLLEKDLHKAGVNSENARQEALRLYHEATARARIARDYLDEITSPNSGYPESPQALKEQCTELQDLLAQADERSTQLNELTAFLSLQNTLLLEKLKRERYRRRQLEREFEKMGLEDFGRLVEPFLSKGMFEKHARR